jgi:hypothetical protein
MSGWGRILLPDSQLRPKLRGAPHIPRLCAPPARSPQQPLRHLSFIDNDRESTRIAAFSADEGCAGIPCRTRNDRSIPEIAENRQTLTSVTPRSVRPAELEILLADFKDGFPGPRPAVRGARVWPLFAKSRFRGIPHIRNKCSLPANRAELHASAFRALRGGSSTKSSRMVAPSKRFVTTLTDRNRGGTTRECAVGPEAGLHFRRRRSCGHYPIPARTAGFHSGVRLNDLVEGVDDR